MEERPSDRTLKLNLEKHILNSDIALSYLFYKRSQYLKLHIHNPSPFDSYMYDELIGRITLALNRLKELRNCDLEDDGNYSIGLSNICILMTEINNKSKHSRFESDFYSFKQSYYRDNKLGRLINDSRD